MNKLQELRAKKASLAKEMRGLTDKAEAEKRELTADEEKRFDELEAEVAKVTKAIEREERLLKHETELRTVPESERAERPQPDERSRVEVGKTHDKDPNKFSTLGEFLLAVRDAANPERRVDPRLSTRAATGMNESVPSDGGFLVQQDLAPGLLKRMYETGEIMRRVRKVPISANSNGLKINALKENSRADGSRWGGIRAYWTPEAGLKTSSQPEFRQIELNLNKLTGLCYATDELLQDAAALEAVITDAFAEEFTFRCEDAVINGTGVGQPLGILNSGALISVAIEATQDIATSAAFLAVNAAKMRARLPGRSRRNAVWLVNPEIEPYLTVMTVGGSGGAVPVYLPSGSITGAVGSTLLGIPVVAAEYMAALGTPGDMLLVDLSEYLWIDKGPMQSATSIHVRFIYDETTFRFVYRCDGQPIWNSALTPYKGSATLSPYVALAVRS